MAKHRNALLYHATALRDAREATFANNTSTAGFIAIEAAGAFLRGNPQATLGVTCCCLLALLCEEEISTGGPRTLHAQSKKGDTALHKAADGGDADVITVLLTAGADLHAQNNDGDTPLHKAALGGYAEAIAALVAAGANPNVTNKYGSTPLHKAADGNHAEAITALLAAGADPNVANK